MRFVETGKVARDFYVVGHSGIPVYLLDGPRPILFDAGVSAYTNAYIRDIRAILGPRKPACLFLTHAHFDHVGSAGAFKRLWPDLEIVASHRCAELLSRPNAVKLITQLSADAVAMAKAVRFTPLNEKAFELFTVDHVAEPGQVFNLTGEITIQAMDAPGHTRDFMCYWIKERKILIASEAVGNDDGTGTIQPEFLVDIEAYRKTINTLARLSVEILCPGHYMVLTGADARRHLQNCPKHTLSYLTRAESFLRETAGDIDAAAELVKAVEWVPRPLPKQTEQAYMLNTRQRMRKIWERMQVLSEGDFIEALPKIGEIALH